MPLLNLPHYTSSIIEENDHDIHIELIPDSSTKPICSECNSKELQSFGKRRLQFMDIPIRGKRVGLNIDVQRYRCKNCKKIIQSELPLMSDNYRMTERLERHIKKESILRPFTHLAEEIGVTEGTIRKIFNDHKDSLSEKLTFATPKIMGIDEIHLAKQPRCVITNIEERTIIEMLRDRNKTTVIKYLRGLHDAHIILNVAMDMWKPYKDSVHSVLPHATIVIDKFHVVRMANDALEKCRKQIRAKMPVKQRRDLMNDRFIMLKRNHELKPREQFLLSHWKENYPLLGKVYELKESFYSIYEARDSKEAYNRYNEWENGLTAEIRPFFYDLHRAVSNWHNEIFTYFDYPITNAYTESMNSVIRHIDRAGRSYGFESIRAKILYSSNLHNRYDKPKFAKKKPSQSRRTTIGKSMADDWCQSYGVPEFETINYGVSIDKLAEMLESGKLRFDV